MSSSPEGSGDLIRQTLIVCAIGVAVAAIIGLLFVARSILPLVFGAILIAVVFNHLGGKLDNLLPAQMPRPVRIAAVIVGVSIAIIAFGFMFANSASEQAIELADRVESSVQKVVAAAKDHPFVNRFLNSQSEKNSVIPSSVESFGIAKRFFATTFGVLTDCLILAILSIYFCVSPTKYRNGILQLVPTSWREELSELLGESSRTLWRWMLGRVLAMTVVGVLFGIGLLVVGVPMALELGIFAALVTFIPNIGGIAAVLPALLLASQQGSTAVIAVGLLYLGIQFVESYLITPLVQEHQVALPPAMVILAQIVAGLLFGFWGIVFATPMFAVTHLWLRRLYIEKWINGEDESR